MCMEHSQRDAHMQQIAVFDAWQSEPKNRAPLKSRVAPENPKPRHQRASDNSPDSSEIRRRRHRAYRSWNIARLGAGWLALSGGLARRRVVAQAARAGRRTLLRTNHQQNSLERPQGRKMFASSGKARKRGPRACARSTCSVVRASGGEAFASPVGGEFPRSKKPQNQGLQSIDQGKGRANPDRSRSKHRRFSLSCRSCTKALSGASGATENLRVRNRRQNLSSASRLGATQGQCGKRDWSVFLSDAAPSPAGTSEALQGAPSFVAGTHAHARHTLSVHLRRRSSVQQRASSTLLPRPSGKTARRRCVSKVSRKTGAEVGCAYPVLPRRRRLGSLVHSGRRCRGALSGSRGLRTGHCGGPGSGRNRRRVQSRRSQGTNRCRQNRLPFLSGRQPRPCKSPAQSIADVCTQSSDDVGSRLRARAASLSTRKHATTNHPCISGAPAENVRVSPSATNDRPAPHGRESRGYEPLEGGIRKTLSASGHSLPQGSQPPRSAKDLFRLRTQARKPDKSQKPSLFLRPPSESRQSLHQGTFFCRRPTRRRTKAGKRASRRPNTLRPTCPDRAGGTHPCIGSSCHKRLREPLTRQTTAPLHTDAKVEAMSRWGWNQEDPLRFRTQPPTRKSAAPQRERPLPPPDTGSKAGQKPKSRLCSSDPPPSSDNPFIRGHPVFCRPSHKTKNKSRKTGKSEAKYLAPDLS